MWNELLDNKEPHDARESDYSESDVSQENGDSIRQGSQPDQSSITARKKKKLRLSESVMILISAVVGAVIAATAGFIASLYILKEQMNVEQIMLTRALTEEFYNDELYAEIRSAIDSCDTLYIANGGPYSHDKINRYLGFFEDLGFYSNTKKFLDLDMVSHSVGAHLVEAYAYPELRIYVKDIQKHQPLAFTEFDQLHDRLIRNYAEYGNLANNFTEACSQ